MDVVREGTARNAPRRAYICFNPCSNGCRSGSAEDTPAQPDRFVVSILVLMDVVREAQGCRLCISLRSGFNPCSNGCRSGRS